jgi:hypothetical protein
LHGRIEAVFTRFYAIEGRRSLASSSVIVLSKRTERAVASHGDSGDGGRDLLLLANFLPFRANLRRSGRGRVIYFDDGMADQLTALRGPGESYSDVILRLVQIGAAKH